MLMRTFGKYLMIIAVLLGAILAGAGGLATSKAWAAGDCCMPCIDLVKTGPATAMPGDVIAYEYRVKNCGNVLLGSGAFVYDQMFHPTEPIWSGNLQPGDVVTFYKNYTIPAYSCGAIVNTALAIGIPDESLAACYGVPNAQDKDSHTVVVICDGGGPGTGTPGYWKNHPEAWPVASLILGGVTYSQNDALAIMMTSGKGDKTYTMFNALVSAKLNVLMGNNSSCIAATIAAADRWMAMYDPVGSGVRGDSYAWSVGEPLYRMLDKYNNGLLCAPHR